MRHTLLVLLLCAAPLWAQSTQSIAGKTAGM